MTDGLKEGHAEREWPTQNYDRSFSVLVCTVTGCVGATVCVRVCLRADTFEPDLARLVSMSSWLRPAYGISMRKRLGS